MALALPLPRPNVPIFSSGNLAVPSNFRWEGGQRGGSASPRSRLQPHHSPRSQQNGGPRDERPSTGSARRFPGTSLAPKSPRTHRESPQIVPDMVKLSSNSSSYRQLHGSHARTPSKCEESAASSCTELRQTGWLRKHFEIDGPLGRGAFGEVLAGRRRADGRRCALKRVGLQNLDESAAQKARQEAMLLRKLTSPYVVEHLDSFVEDGDLHIVMELCEGGCLATLLRDRSSSSSSSISVSGAPSSSSSTSNPGVFPEEEVRRLAGQALRGLAYLHSRRVLHRDLKPANVLLTKRGCAKLGDLGVAKELLPQERLASTVVGSPAYMAPELLEAKPYNEASDLWSFGCLLYELCTLERPFQAVSAAALFVRILQGRVPSLPKDAPYSSALRSACSSCLKRQPERRSTAPQLLLTACFVESPTGLVEQRFRPPGRQIPDSQRSKSLSQTPVSADSTGLSAASSSSSNSSRQKLSTSSTTSSSQGQSQSGRSRSQRLLLPPRSTASPSPRTYGELNRKKVAQSKTFTPRGSGGNTLEAPSGSSSNSNGPTQKDFDNSCSNRAGRPRPPLPPAGTSLENEEVTTLLPEELAALLESQTKDVPIEEQTLLVFRPLPAHPTHHLSSKPSLDALRHYSNPLEQEEESTLQTAQVDTLDWTCLLSVPDQIEVGAANQQKPVRPLERDEAADPNGTLDSLAFSNSSTSTLDSACGSRSLQEEEQQQVVAEADHRKDSKTKPGLIVDDPEEEHVEAKKEGAVTVPTIILRPSVTCDTDSSFGAHLDMTRQHELTILLPSSSSAAPALASSAQSEMMSPSDFTILEPTRFDSAAEFPITPRSAPQYSHLPPLLLQVLKFSDPSVEAEVEAETCTEPVEEGEEHDEDDDEEEMEDEKEEEEEEEEEEELEEELPSDMLSKQKTIFDVGRHCSADIAEILGLLTGADTTVGTILQAESRGDRSGGGSWNTSTASVTSSEEDSPRNEDDAGMAADVAPNATDPSPRQPQSRWRWQASRGSTHGSSAEEEAPNDDVQDILRCLWGDAPPSQAAGSSSSSTAAAPQLSTIDRSFPDRSSHNPTTQQTTTAAPFSPWTSNAGGTDRQRACSDTVAQAAVRSSFWQSQEEHDKSASKPVLDAPDLLPHSLLRMQQQQQHQHSTVRVSSQLRQRWGSAPVNVEVEATGDDMDNLAAAFARGQQLGRKVAWGRRPEAPAPEVVLGVPDRAPGDLSWLQAMRRAEGR